jgi:signal transduction histidine kinase
VLLVAAVLIDQAAVQTPLVGLDDVFAQIATGRATHADLLSSGMVAFGQGVVLALYVLAAVYYRRLFRREGLVGHAFLAAGLVVAAFSQLHFAVDPVVQIGTVTASDALRVGFYALLFLGIQADVQADLASLRAANDELQRLREVDAANAALDERTRLAREIHDGLAQDLWYAKLKQSRLVSAPDLDDETRATVREVATALDSALAEARGAVMAMRTDPASADLARVIQHYVSDFTDRFGVRVAFEAPDRLPQLPARAEAEILRIVQEALNNSRKHADATLVRVRVESVDTTVRITVADNGRGFDPTKVPDDRYGLRSMAERAELVHGRLAVESAPSDGTRVILELPRDGATDGAR